MAYENLPEELINELSKDGRASFRALADELDVSVTTVSNHLTELEEEGVITGYIPRVDYGEFGYDVTAISRLKVDGEAIPEITERLEEQKHIVSLYEVTGDHDIIVIGKFQDTDHMDDQIKKIVTDPDVKESNTSIVLNTVQENQQFELDY